MLVLTHTFNPFGSQVSRGTDFVHPMLPFLIATSLSCSEAQELVDKMRTYNVEEETKSEMIQIVKDEAPKDCWDAND